MNNNGGSEPDAIDLSQPPVILERKVRKKILRFARIIASVGGGSLRSRLSRLREIRLNDICELEAKDLAVGIFLTLMAWGLLPPFIVF